MPKYIQTANINGATDFRFNDLEMKVIRKLGAKQNLSPEKVITQALRLYESTVNPVDLGSGGCGGDD